MPNSASVRLIELTRSDLTALVDDPAAFATARGFELGEVSDAVVETAGMMAGFYDTAGIDAPWGAYLAIDDSRGLAVGVGSFKGAPNGDRAIEIAYATFPVFEGQGIASQTAAQLVAIAHTSPHVDLVVAHTLREERASVRILRRIGFQFTGEVIDDPDDGPVWRWELPA